MNKDRRKELKRVLECLENCSNDLEDIKCDEEETNLNRPENLAYSEAAQRSEDCIDAMDNAISSIQEAIDVLVEIA